MPRGRKKEQPTPQAADEPAMIQCARHGLIHAADDHCFECEAEEITAAQDEQPTTPSAPEPVPEPELRKQPITEYTCIDCEFRGSPEEALEHTTATNHTTEGVEPEPEQVELFREPGIITRHVRRKISDGYLLEIKTELANVYAKHYDLECEKTVQVTTYNDLIKPLKKRMDELAAILHDPYEEKPVECIWIINLERNSRMLHCIDSGELLEERPLTAEDRAAEIARAGADNSTRCSAKGCGHPRSLHTPHCTDNGFDVPCDCGQFVEPVAQEAAHAG